MKTGESAGACSCTIEIFSDGQGFVGKGKGHSVVTLTKPLPAMRVGGYPQFSGRVKP